MKRILIIEDDKKLSDGIRLALHKEYLCSQAYSLMSAEKEFDVRQFDLVLLDVNFADGSGMEYLVEIRRKSLVPVILITANNMEMDIVSGLEQGANDYITKPFSLMVLRARVDVQLRNSGQNTDIFKDGDFYFDFYKMEFLYKSTPVCLSGTEQRLLRCLIENRGRSVSRSHLIDETWQKESEFVEEHTLTVAINRLRKKLGIDKDQPEYIKTVYGVGYIW
ncbi:MAG: response regulator transcription factor [Lachnospiraceae bacterium]